MEKINIDLFTKEHKKNIDYIGPPMEYDRNTGIKLRLDSQWDCTSMLFSDARFRSFCCLCKLKEEALLEDMERFEFVLKGLIRCEMSKELMNNADSCIERHFRRLFGTVKKKPDIKRTDVLDNYKENLKKRRENLNKTFELEIDEDKEPLSSWRGIINLKLISEIDFICNCPLASWRGGCPHKNKIENLHEFPLVLLQFQNTSLTISEEYMSKYYHDFENLYKEDFQYLYSGLMKNLKLNKIIKRFLESERSKTLTFINQCECPEK